MKQRRSVRRANTKTQKAQLARKQEYRKQMDRCREKKRLAALPVATAEMLDARD